MNIREHRASRRLGAVHFVCAPSAPTPPRRVSRWPLRILEVVIVAIAAMAIHALTTTM